jgi:16S rRNA (guanine527-N7)-methyltransferase
VSSLQELLASCRLAPLSQEVEQRFSQYLELIERWNRRINLTSVRDPEQIISRHFLEGCVSASYLPADVRTLLDFGSGFGIPGVPIAIVRPELRVVLAESHGKKAAFLNEVARTLGIEVEVVAERVEQMDSGRLFDAVTMRAVEKMGSAIPAAAVRARRYMLLLAGARSEELFRSAAPDFAFSVFPMPRSDERVLMVGSRGVGSTWNNAADPQERTS